MPRFPIVLLAAGLAGSTPALAADSSCTQLTLGATLRDAAERAQEAFGATRVDEFQAAIAELDGLVPCLMEPVDPELAALVHRMKGLASFIQRDQDRAREAFAAARALEPDYAWPEELIPWGHPLLGLYRALSVEEAAFDSVPSPSAGWVYMDGRPSEPRPLEWPVILQVSDSEGAIHLSSYLWPGDPLPDYGLELAEAPTATPVPVPEPVPVAEPELPVSVAATSTTVRTGPRPAWLVGAGAAAVTSGVLYALAARSHGEYWDEQTPYTELDAARGRTNGLVLASAGAAGVALGTGVVAFLELQW
jgi:hypothetical protein